MASRILIVLQPGPGNTPLCAESDSAAAGVFAALLADDAVEAKEAADFESACAPNEDQPCGLNRLLLNGEAEATTGLSAGA